MIRCYRYKHSPCRALLNFTGNQPLTKQKAQPTTGPRRKKDVFRRIFLMVCAWFMIGRLAYADDWVGFPLAENEHIMSYQENGDVLCSSLNHEGQLTAIKKLNHSGEVQWMHNFSEPYVQGSVLFRAREDDQAFVLCGRVKSANQFEAVMIGADGIVQSRGILPTPYQPRALIDTGILFTSPYDAEHGKHMIYYSGWDGKKSQSAFLGKLLDVQQAIAVDSHVFLNVIYEQQDSARIASIISIDLETGSLSHYDIGKEENWSIQAIGKSRDNGVIVAACKSNQHEQRIVDLAPSGEVQWTTTLYSDLYGPNAQIIRSCGSDHYEIWGTAGIRNVQEEYPERYITYRIELGENGELMDSVIGTYSGNCVEYKNTQVYVVDVDESNYVSLDTFKTDSRVSKSHFYTKIEE